MKLLVLLPDLGSHKTFYFYCFLGQFFCNIFSSEFPIKLPNEPSYSIHVFFTIVSRETKVMLMNVAQGWDGQTFSSVPNFADKILAICWILEVLLAAKVVEEVVECFVHLHAFPRILAIDSPRAMTSNENLLWYQGSTRVQRGARDAATKLAKLVVLMYQEVTVGNFLLKTTQRVALLENWRSLLGMFLGKNILDEATKQL